MTTELKELRTIKKAAEIIGCSERFLEQLTEEGKLTRYRINSAVYISLVEFEALARPVDKRTIKAYVTKYQNHDSITH